MSLKGKKVVITGGARGLGAAIAEAVAKAGADVVIADINGAAAANTAKALNAEARCTGRVDALTVDVTDKSSVAAMFEGAIDTLGHIDVLFSNAGIIKVHGFVDIEESDWDAIMAVNVKGVFLCGQAAARHMLSRGAGKIINTASVAGRRGVPGSAAYGASKAAVISLTQSMAAGLTSKGITVNAIAPGIVDTDMWDSIDAQTAALTGRPRGATRDARVKQVPVGRAATPNDIAGVCVFLASSASDYISGQTLNIEGGEIMN